MGRETAHEALELLLVFRLELGFLGVLELDTGCAEDVRVHFHQRSPSAKLVPSRMTVEPS